MFSKKDFIDLYFEHVLLEYIKIFEEVLWAKEIEFAKEYDRI